MTRGGRAYTQGVAITPVDADLAKVADALFIGGAGAVKVDILNGADAVIFTATVVPYILPVAITRVYTTDTAATLMVALNW